MKIEITTPIYPTEDIDKLKNALSNLFSTEFREEEGVLYGEKENITDLMKYFLERGLLDLVKELLEKNKSGDTSYFEIDKQAAVVGKIHLVEEEGVLGNVKVKIENVEDFLQGLNEL